MKVIKLVVLLIVVSVLFSACQPEARPTPTPPTPPSGPPTFAGFWIGNADLGPEYGITKLEFNTLTGDWSIRQHVLNGYSDLISGNKMSVRLGDGSANVKMTSTDGESVNLAGTFTSLLYTGDLSSTVNDLHGTFNVSAYVDVSTSKHKYK